LCRQHNVQLVLLDPLDDPIKQIDGLIRMLSRAGRVLAQGQRSPADKEKWQPRLSAARNHAEEVRRAVARQPEQMMANLSDSWRDRETGFAAAVEPAPLPKPSRGAVKALQNLQVGQRVAHVKFGPGVVTARAGKDDEATVTILFDGEQERTFLLSLVADKLSPATV
jgi:hypothetical protein